MELKTISDQISTERLELRPIEQQDALFLYDLRSDPQVNKYIDRQAPASITVIHDFIAARMKESQDLALARFWVLFLKPALQPVGTICLWNANDEQESIELGYELSPSHQGLGLMTEAAIAVMLETLQSTTGIQKISAFTKPENLASNKLLARLGFEITGTEGKFTIWSCLTGDVITV